MDNKNIYSEEAIAIERAKLIELADYAKSMGVDVEDNYVNADIPWLTGEIEDTDVSVHIDYDTVYERYFFHLLVGNRLLGKGVRLHSDDDAKRLVTNFKKLYKSV